MNILSVQLLSDSLANLMNGTDLGVVFQRTAFNIGLYRY
jgi:hypothetical protein